MPYQTIQPHERLAPFVENIWVQEDLRDAAREAFVPTTVLPTTRLDMLFFYRDPFIELGVDGPLRLPRFFLLGQKTRPDSVAATGQTGIIIFSFKPGGGFPIFNLPLHEFIDCKIPFSEFMNPAEIAVLEDRVMNAENNHQRIDILQAFLLSLLDENQFDPLVRHTTQVINTQLGNIRVSSVAEDAGLGRRQYERRFRSSIGLSPRKFANVIRFQKALLMLRQGVHWADIVVKCGYYDQAHFIKEVKTFSGLTPNAIRENFQPTPLKSFFQYHLTMSHFYNTLYL